MSAGISQHISMQRAHWRDLPHFEAPPDFKLRWYRPGDEQSWLKVQRAAEKYVDITLDVYDFFFGRDPRKLAERQCFLISSSGSVVGTATAWYCGESECSERGLFHWLAVHPAFQRRGLAKSLVSAVCERMRDLGHTSAILHTQPVRLPAIRLYRSFGFEPVIADAAAREVWRRVNEACGCP